MTQPLYCKCSEQNGLSTAQMKFAPFPSILHTSRVVVSVYVSISLKLLTKIGLKASKFLCIPVLAIVCLRTASMSMLSVWTALILNDRKVSRPLTNVRALKLVI